MENYIVLNPASAGGHGAEIGEKVRKILEEKNIPHTLVQSTPQKSLTDICREITSRGVETNVVAIGGDGAVNEVINGIRDLGKTRFGVIPAGTGNDFIRNFDIPKDLNTYVSMLFEGKVRHTIDMPVVTMTRPDGTQIVKRCVNSCELGYGAEVCHLVDRSKIKNFFNRIRLGKIVFLIEALRSIFHVVPYSLALDRDGQIETMNKCLSTIVMNLKYEGGGMIFCPEARGDDNELSICVGYGISKARFGLILPLAYFGKIGGRKGVLNLTAKEITIASDTPQYAHTDGEAVEDIIRMHVRIPEEKLQLLI